MKRAQASLLLLAELVLFYPRAPVLPLDDVWQYGFHGAPPTKGFRATGAGKELTERHEEDEEENDDDEEEEQEEEEEDHLCAAPKT